MFFRIKHSDPYRAVSWDKLHAYAIGLFGDHLWEDILKLVDLLDREDIAAIDKQ